MGKVEKGVEKEEMIEEVRYFELKREEVVELWLRRVEKQEEKRWEDLRDGEVSLEQWESNWEVVESVNE